MFDILASAAGLQSALNLLHAGQDRRILFCISEQYEFFDIVCFGVLKEKKNCETH